MQTLVIENTNFSFCRRCVQCCIFIPTFFVQVLFVVFEKAWILGAALCKILLYGQIVTLASTTFILTSMSLDRYLAICRPLVKSRPKMMILISWLLAFIFATPQLLIFTQVCAWHRCDVSAAAATISIYSGESDVQSMTFYGGSRDCARQYIADKAL
jgi:hypothetical protein